MYDEESSLEDGPKGTFENFKAEGDVLFKKEEYNKALNSYTTVCQIPPKNKIKMSIVKLFPTVQSLGHNGFLPC